MEIEKTKNDLEQEFKYHIKTLREEMYKSLHIQGKVTPKISEDQAKMTGK